LFRLRCGLLPAEADHAGAVQSHHQDGNEHQLEDDAGNGVHQRLGQEDLPGERHAGHAGHHHPHRSPDDPAAHHSSQQSTVQGHHTLPAGPIVQKARDATVSRQLKGHGHSGHQRRHSEERHPHQRGHESHHRAIPPAADQAAEEHGQVHGQQHPADLGDLSGEEGQYQRQGQEHGRQDQVMDICFEIAVFHGVKLLLKKSFRAAFWRRTSLLAFFTESAGL